MIVAFSTSSPLASVALISPDGSVLASAEESAPMGASGTSLKLLQQLLADLGRHLSAADLFLADLGPGSFTGVKVGVTLAKTLAFAQGKPAGGATSFDLIDPNGTVVLPSKRGEWFIRRPGQHPVRVGTLPEEAYTGYGLGIDPPVYPRAAGFGSILQRVKPGPAEVLVPEYLIEPAISKPKTPYRPQSS